jgi:hypothetical protein
MAALAVNARITVHDGMESHRSASSLGVARMPKNYHGLPGSFQFSMRLAVLIAHLK